jgi:hypothetical protein
MNGPVDTQFGHHDGHRVVIDHICHEPDLETGIIPLRCRSIGRRTYRARNESDGCQKSHEESA